MTTENQTLLHIEIFNEMNLVRRFPHEYAKYLDQMIPFFKGKIFDMPFRERVLTIEGKDAVVEAANFLRSGPTQFPQFTEISEGLCEAAKVHVEDTGKSGARSHIGTDGSLPTDRIRKIGGWHKLAAENLCFGATSAREIVLSFLIDDGIKDRSHRKNLLNSEYKVVGVHYGDHSSTHVMTCVVFATGFGAGAVQNLKIDLNILNANNDEVEPLLDQLMDTARTNLDHEKPKQKPTNKKEVPSSGRKELKKDDTKTSGRGQVGSARGTKK
eukprot:c14926_g1_i2.p1 GENE.c14926_g1_i2~~c14926_g1_i2.p1  ORF type:complete len:270 (+),score=109.21 c14926_g1_i2:64-873(+)